MSLTRLLAALRRAAVPQVVLDRTQVILAGKPIDFHGMPFMVISRDPKIPWGPVGADNTACFPPATYFVLDLQTV